MCAPTRTWDVTFRPHASRSPHALPSRRADDSIAKLGEDRVARHGLLGGLGLRELGLLGLVVHGALGLPLGLEPLDHRLLAPAQLVREAAEHAVAAADLQPRDAEGVRHNHL